MIYNIYIIRFNNLSLDITSSVDIISTGSSINFSVNELNALNIAYISTNITTSSSGIYYINNNI